MALPRSARLRDGRDIRLVGQHGARARAGDVSVVARVAPPGAPVAFPPPVPARAAVVVGRRAGGAVDRNRLRRRLQHVLLPLLPLLPPGTDLVVRSGPAARALSSQELDAAVRSSVRRAVERASA